MQKELYLILATIFIISCSPKIPAKTNNEMQELIETLIQDSSKHEEVSATISIQEITSEEIKLGVKLPESYKYFLTKFGNGAESLYHIDQPINGVNQEYGGIHWLDKYHGSKPSVVESDGFGSFKMNSLLCLMTENSNGGSWVWITSENAESGEWPLAYYDPFQHKLFYKVPNFKEWIRLATQCKGEVIRELDKEYKLNLG